MGGRLRFSYEPEFCSCETKIRFFWAWQKFLVENWIRLFKWLFPYSFCGTFVIFCKLQFHWMSPYFICIDRNLLFIISESFLLFKKIHKSVDNLIKSLKHAFLSDYTWHDTTGVVIVLIVWQLDFRLPAQSVSTTTKVMSLNPVHDQVYSIQHYVTHFVSDLQQLNGFLWLLRFTPPIKLTATI